MPDRVVAGFSNPIVEAGLLGLVALYGARAVTPVEAAETYLSRIERLDGALGAITELDAAGALDAARASAARWASGTPASPIDGAPLLVKANIAVAGLPWTAGIAAYRDRVASQDAACISRLRAAGAVILGLVNMHEGALGATTDNPAFGRTHNPHRHGWTPGGSSGGSGAAVAAGLCAGALGTDTMGSVRIPSGYCGVFGHKPAYDLVSTEGVTALSWTLDHVGVHGRSAEDCAALLAALRERAPAGPERQATRPLAVLDFGGQVEVSSAVAQGFAETLDRARAAGFRLDQIRLEGYDFGRLRRLGLLISEAEGFVEHREALAANPEGFSEGFRKLLQYGAGQSAERLASAHREVRDVARRVRAQLSPYAGLLLPTAPQVSFPFGEAHANQADFTALADFTGWPATAFPIGIAEGLPLSAQVMAADDDGALAMAATLATPIRAPAGFVG